jgi:hypothetical protein
MRVVQDQSANDPASGAATAFATIPATRVTPQPPTSALREEGTAQTPKPAALFGSTPSIALPTDASPANVTFRRDEQGRVYYVLTDAASGKEIREVPPAEIRKVGQGITEFLKQEAAKNTSRVKTKA